MSLFLFRSWCYYYILVFCSMYHIANQKKKNKRLLQICCDTRGWTILIDIYVCVYVSTQIVVMRNQKEQQTIWMRWARMTQKKSHCLLFVLCLTLTQKYTRAKHSTGKNNATRWTKQYTSAINSCYNFSANFCAFVVVGAVCLFYITFSTSSFSCKGFCFFYSFWFFDVASLIF